MAGRYEFGDFIASGGMAEVWRARDKDYSRDVAIKLLKPEYADDPVSRARFDAEARHVQSLEHPNVAAVYDVGEMPTASGLIRPYLTMEYVPGRPLSAIIAQGPVAPQTVQALLAQAGDGLAAAHSAGIVHRDVKPANLIVTESGTLKITDFGIARSASQGAVTVTGQVVGTPQYLSPEQARGEVASPASDVYGLGVVAYEALTGSRPFDRPTAVATALAHLEDPVPALPDSVPPGLAAVVERALAKDPAERYADGSAFADAMRAADLSMPAASPEEPQVEQTVVVAAAASSTDVGPEDVPTQAIDAVDLPLAVAEPAATDFVPTTEAPVAKKVDPLAPQRSQPKPTAEPVAQAADRADGATHARTTVVRLPKSVQRAGEAVGKRTQHWPFGTLDTVLVALGALTILALGWVAYFISGNAPAAPAPVSASVSVSTTPSSTPTASQTSTAPEIDCDTFKYRQFDSVKADIEADGYVVNGIPTERKGHTNNQVWRATNCRGAQAGDTIDVYYYSDNATATSGATP